MRRPPCPPGGGKPAPRPQETALSSQVGLHRPQLRAICHVRPPGFHVKPPSRASSKLQIPTSNEVLTLKVQVPNWTRRTTGPLRWILTVWRLELHWKLGIGIWNFRPGWRWDMPRAQGECGECGESGANRQNRHIPRNSHIPEIPKRTGIVVIAASGGAGEEGSENSHLAHLAHLAGKQGCFCQKQGVSSHLALLMWLPRLPRRRRGPRGSLAVFPPPRKRPHPGAGEPHKGYDRRYAVCVGSKGNMRDSPKHRLSCARVGTCA